MVFVIYGVSPSFSQEIVNETFEAILDYNKTENVLTYYNIVETSEALSKSGEKSDIGFDHEIRVTNSYESEGPSIMDKKYKVKLYAADNHPEQSGGPNSGLVDKTYISHGELVKRIAIII